MGHSLVFMPECHSTNDEASRIIHADNAVEGTIVITNNQTAGRGQRGNVWESEIGKNLTFSILLRPLFLSPKDQFYLNVAFSLGLRDYLINVLTGDVKIKWPNDILVGGKKICGILIENHLQGQSIQNSVVGIGLNVNQNKLPIVTATSMNLIASKQFDLQEVLADLLGFLEKRYLQLRQNLKRLDADYLSSLYWMGEKRLFKSAMKMFEGTIIGIDETGKLKIEANQEIKYFDIKEVEFLS